jgi:Tol biopolymer transport system component
MLWLRELATDEARALPGSEDALEPFWSPDSRSVAFGAGGKLKRVDLDGGQAQTLADAPRVNGGSWGTSGIILFSPDFRSALYRVPATGGEAVLASAPVPPHENARNYPCFLPDGRRFLFHVNINFAGGAKLMSGSLDSTEVAEVLPRVGYAAYAEPGWLVYESNGALMAQRFEADALRLSGEPRTIETGVESGFRGGRMSLANTGLLLVTHPRPYDYQLVWFDRGGRRVGDAGPARRVPIGTSPVLSPDGTRVAVQIRDLETGNQDIWLIDVARSTLDRLTVDPSMDQLPTWSADGRSLMVTTSRGGKGGIYRIAADGGSEVLVTGEGVRFPLDVSPDDRLLLYGERGAATRMDVWALPLGGSRKPVPVLRTPADEHRPSLSPDARFLAYDSDVTGRAEVYVRTFSPDGRVGQATRVSTGGGVGPRWRADGRELYYVEAPLSFEAARLMAVSVSPAGERLAIGTPEALFPARMLVLSLNPEYDVSADGNRFLVGTVVGDSQAPAATLVLDWTAELPR